MILIVASRKDVASLNIREQILKNYSFKKTADTFQEEPLYTAEVAGKNMKLATLQAETNYSQNITENFNPELLIYISRHSSLSGTPTLSVHTPGNFGKAELGGIPRRISISPANAMRDALKAMMQFKTENSLEYEVSYECTHHGPSLDVPAMFVELGSSPTQWGDSKAAEAVAHSAIAAASKFDGSHVKTVIGIGGPHYSSKFTRMALETELCFGHMVPKYAVPYVDESILKQCLERTLEKVESVFLDWKGIKGESKPSLVKILEEMGVSFEKV